MNKVNLAVKIIGATGLFILSAACQAGCTVSSPITPTAGGIPDTLSVSGSLAVGSKIGNEITVPDTSKAHGIKCSGGTTWSLLRLNPNWTQSTIADVYNTSIPGIGVKIRDDYSSSYSNFYYLPALTTNLKTWYSPGTNYGYGWLSGGDAYLAGIKVQYYVTGPVTPGIYSPETMVETWMNNIISIIGGANYINLMSPPITVKKLTCETPNISVDLDKHMSSEFSGINSKSVAKAFNFEIKNCSSDMNSVNYTFKPAAGVTLKQAGTSNQYITLDGSSTATGVGIQVLYENDTLVPFNSKIKYTGYNKTTGGSYTIPMKARYIQTASTITGGTANSAVEFTMSYE